MVGAGGVWKQFPSVELLRSARCRAVIILALTMASVDGSALEALHATVRRLILAAAVHTHVRSFSDVNASWLMLTARRLANRRAKTEKTAEAKAKAKPMKLRISKRKQMSSAAEVPKPKHLRTGGGGPWRLFVRERL